MYACKTADPLLISQSASNTDRPSSVSRRTSNIELDPLLTPPEAAEWLGVTVGTLAVWRSTKRYSLQHEKVGRRAVRYYLSEVLRFLEEWKPLRPQ